VKPRDLVRLALAWPAGGAAGVEVLGSPRDIEPDEAEEARAALSSLGRVRVQGNRVSAPGVQLRLATDGRW
jgi:hypothetical protein